MQIDSVYQFTASTSGPASDNLIGAPKTSAENIQQKSVSEAPHIRQAQTDAHKGQNINIEA